MHCHSNLFENGTGSVPHNPIFSSCCGAKICDYAGPTPCRTKRVHTNFPTQTLPTYPENTRPLLTDYQDNLLPEYREPEQSWPGTAVRHLPNAYDNTFFACFG